MDTKIAKKLRMITLYDWQVGSKTIRNDIAVIYLVVEVQNSSIGQDAIHLHIDLDESIDRNIFTDDFCKKFFDLLPDTFEIYYGNWHRCKMKNIDIAESIIRSLV